jgi:hypothetical protein
VQLVLLLLALLLALGVLALALPRMRESANRVQCTKNLKDLGEAILQRNEMAKQRALPGDKQPNATWALLLTPYLSGKQPPLLEKWDLSKSYYEQPAELRQTQFAIYYCPSRRQPPANSVEGDVPRTGPPDGKHYAGALGDYACPAGNGQLRTPWDLLPRLQQQQATGFTALLSEKHVPWDRFGRVADGDGSLYNSDYPTSFTRMGGRGYPLARSITDDFHHNFGSAHPDLCQFLMGDVSVRPLVPWVSETVLGRMTARDEMLPENP